MKTGKHTFIDGEIDVKYPQFGNLIIGSFCTINKGLKVILGNECNLDNISTFDFKSRLKWETTNATRLTKGDVVIGNDVWIGENVTIRSGVTIGDGAVILHNSFVTKQIDPYQIWGGNPANFIVPRRYEPDVRWLLKIKWWDWPDEHIAKASTILSNYDNSLKELRKYYSEKILGKLYPTEFLGGKKKNENTN